MIQWLAVVLWGLTALIAGGVAVRRGQTPVDQPLLPAIALGALFGSVGAGVGLTTTLQFAVAAGVALGLIVLLWRWRTLMIEDNLPPGVGGRRLIGVDGRVVAAIRPEEPGTIRVGEETWRARLAAGAPGVVTEGAAVRVVAIEGIHVVVSPLDEQSVPITSPHEPQHQSPEDGGQ
ncbi:NfeD family protein [Euzebya tangerina]|uniref:NfeD family protein n=1 Tax=Euzebya tangerina TaxID=591198 RepID=UPI000E318A57|nr:NfeD family protein [Euzebya tangerina]